MKRRIAEQILRFRLLLLVIGILLTLLFLYKSSQIILRDNPNRWPPPNHPNVLLNNLILETFGGANVVVIQVEVKEGDIFNSETLSKVHRISDKILEMDGVVPYYLTSLSARKVKYMKGYADLYDISFLMEYPPESQQEVEKIKWGVYHNPTIAGALVSPDAKATRIIADFWTEMGGKELTTIPKIYKQIKTICEDEIDSNTKISYAGTPIIIGWVNSEGILLIVLSYIIILVVMSIILWICFKTIIGVLLPVGMGLIASIWAFGIQRLVLGEVLHSASGFLVPCIVIAATTCHAVQFLRRFYGEEYPKSKEAKTAIINTFDAILPPIILSLVTDISAFVVCAFIPFANVSTLGTLAVFGLVSALVCLLIFLPTLLSYFPGSPERLDLEERRGILDRGINQLLMIILKPKGRLVIVICLGFILISTLCIFPRMNIGQDNTFAIHNFLTKSWDRSSIYKMEIEIKNRFKTIYPCNFLISTNKINGLKDPEVLKEIDKLASFLQKIPGVGGVMHLGMFIKVMHRFVHEEDEEYFKIPENGRAIAEYLYLYDMADPGSFEFIVDNDYQNSVLVAYVDNTSHKTVNEMLKKSAGYIQTEINDEKVVVKTAGGAIGIMGAFNESVKRWIILATLLSALASFLVAFILFRSFIAPIFLLIPLFFATIIWYAVMYLSGIEINSNITTGAAMAMGVGIDAEIYLLYRFREEFARVKDFNQAFIESFTKIRKALVFSHFSLIFGCWSVLFVPLYIGYVGYGMGMILLLCFLVSLVFPPILWCTFKPKFLFK